MNRRQEERNQARCLDCRSAKEKNKRSAVKRMVLIMCIALVGITHRAQGQWAVIDPSNLAQNISQVVKSSSQLTNMIKNVEETARIYQQGKEYYDKLKSVHNLIKDARKVQLTVAMISEITQIYTTGFQKMLADPKFLGGRTCRHIQRLHYPYAGGQCAHHGDKEHRYRRERTVDD